MDMRLLREYLHGEDDQSRFSSGLGILFGLVPGKGYPPTGQDDQPRSLPEFFSGFSA